METTTTSNETPATIRPCPRLFPSFTVTRRQARLFEAVREAVAADTYLPPAYRHQRTAAPYGTLVRHDSHYCGHTIVQAATDSTTDDTPQPPDEADTATGIKFK